MKGSSPSETLKPLESEARSSAISAAVSARWTPGRSAMRTVAPREASSDRRAELLVDGRRTEVDLAIREKQTAADHHLYPRSIVPARDQ